MPNIVRRRSDFRVQHAGDSYQLTDTRLEFLDAERSVERVNENLTTGNADVITVSEIPAAYPRQGYFYASGEWVLDIGQEGSNVSDEGVIRVACKTIDLWPTKSSSTLADAIQTASLLDEIRRADLWSEIVTEAVENQGIAEEDAVHALSVVYLVHHYMEDVKLNIVRRDAKGLKVLTDMAKAIHSERTSASWPSGLQTAIDDAVANLSTTPLQRVADLHASTPPSDVTATDVDNALGRS